MKESAGKRFERAYQLGYKAGVASVPPIVQMQSAGTTAPTVTQRPPQMAELIQKRFQDAAKFSQRPLNLHSDLQTPLAVAGAGGALVSAASFVVIGGGVALFVFEPSLKTYATIGWASAVAGLGVTAWNWFSTGTIRMMATYSLENIFNVDIDGDGHTGKPLQSIDAPLGRQMFKVADGRQVNVDVPLSRNEAIAAYEKMRANGWQFSRRKMAGIMSQKSANELSRAMGYYDFIADKATGELNEDGRSFWASVASFATSPTPPPHR